MVVIISKGITFMEIMNYLLSSGICMVSGVIFKSSNKINLEFMWSYFLSDPLMSGGNKKGHKAAGLFKYV